MFKPTALVIIFLLFFVGHSQNVSLPADMRQHTLTQYNASLFNPAFSLDRNNPQSVSFWTRWQWQNIDADPTTLFLNYSRSLNDNSAAALGFFQHNTGIYFNTGASLNYAYQIEFNRLIKLSVGANVFGFSQEIADTRFPVTTIPGVSQNTPTTDFILQVAPGFNLQVENFSMSIASENLFDYNFSDAESNTAAADKIFMGMASYDFPVMASDSTAYVRPSIYLRTIPEQENQIGLNALFSTKKYWVQSGYNNFYGISVGAGATVFNRFSVGALVEFGTSSSLNTKDPSFEILASYYLGKPEKRRSIVASGILDEEEQQVILLGDEIDNEKIKEELENAQQQAIENTGDTKTVDEQVKETEEEGDGIKEAQNEAKRIADEQREQEKRRKLETEQAQKEAEALEKEKALAAAELLKEEKRKEELERAKEEEAQRLEEQRKLDALKDAKKAEAIAAEIELKKQQRILDSIQEVKKAEALEAAFKAQEKQRLDSIAQAKKVAEEAAIVKTEPVVEEPEPGYKYQAVASEEGIEAGFYLVVNIFGTKKYYDLFMKDLTTKGLEPKSFYRKLNQYNYVYLARYDSIKEARKARDNKFNGLYKEKISIFGVKK